MSSLKFKVKTRTKIKDLGANHLLRQIEELGKETVITSGIHAAEGTQLPKHKGKIDGKTPIAQYAYFQEYGTKYIPARPFLRLTIENRKEQFFKESITDMRRMTNGGTTAGMLKKNAEKITKWTKATIWTLRTPANAPATLKRKKKLGRGSNPLIFSKSMRDAVTSKIHKSNMKDRRLRIILNKHTKNMIKAMKAMKT